nr:hypothetical protein [Bacteroides sp.]
MIKKALFLLLALLPLSVMAQQAVGSWYLYPLYNGVPTSVVTTPKLTYYLSLGRLYSYDKANEESTEYSELLNDTEVTVIDYNPWRKFLFVGYASGNVDLVYDNGRIVNLPDIKEAQIAYEKRINQVDFKDDYIYVATDFGLVVFDSNKGVVSQSGIYGSKVNAVGVMGNYLIINTDNKNYGIKRDALLSRFENFQFIDNAYNVAELKGLSDYVLMRTNNVVWAVKYKMSGSDVDFVVPALSGAATAFMRGDNDKIRTICANKLYAYDAGGRTEEASVPTTLSKNAYGTWKGASELWAANADGLGCYDIAVSPMTVKVDRLLPADAISLTKVAFIRGSADGNSIYLTTSGTSNQMNPATETNSRCYMTKITGNKVVDVTPTENIIGVTSLAVHPYDDDMVFISTRTGGVIALKDKQTVTKFNTTNSGLPSLAQHGLYTDPSGNLWVMSLVKNSPIAILPGDKLKGDVTKLTKSDWVTTIVGAAENFTGNSCGEFATIPGSNITYFKCAYVGAQLGVYDHNGTITNTADDKVKVLTPTDYIDQDGKTFTCSYITGLACDKKGSLWVTTDNSLFAIDNAAQGMNPGMRVTRMKVPRNDGTNFADYLLDGEYITAIAVDGSNNKWIGTKNSGLYYVSADGSEILANFNMDNSPLPANAIASLYCAPNSNEVYVGTALGLLRYSGLHAPGQESYDNVYAYPNPVKPDYTGWITVTGLMNNSLVKIADASGSVVYQGRSDGGMFTWDGCNSAGVRVKSGVYYVFASQNESGSSSAAVTKILIMN